MIRAGTKKPSHYSSGYWRPPKRVLGKEHPSTLLRAGNLATLYKKRGRYAEAEALLKRVLETDERVLGKEHPETLSFAGNLAAQLGR